MSRIGRSMTKGKSTLSDFAVDASLDLSKSVVAAAVGGGVGAAVSSAFPGGELFSALQQVLQLGLEQFGRLRKVMTSAIAVTALRGG